MKNILILALGGMLGTLTRYGITVGVARHWTHQFPLATFAINVSGSFVIGLFLTYAAERLELDSAWRLFIATGFLGAYTTFSAYEYETAALAKSGAAGWALAYAIVSVVLGFLAVKLGIALGRPG